MIPPKALKDLFNICRLCLKDGEFINIFERPDLINVYFTNTNLVIKDSDGLPKNICKECINKLEDVLEFIQTCKHSHDCLTAIILHHNDKDTLPNIDISISECLAKNEHEDDNSELDIEENECEIKTEVNLEIPTDKNKVKDFKLVKKPFIKECRKCRRKFQNNNLYKAHAKKHFNLNVASSKGFFENQDSLKKHYKAGTRQWRCFECNKEFTKKNDLQRHLRIHSGFRPYMCSICDLKFTQKSTLNRHISAIHILDEKDKYNFECYICEKKFNRKDHLESHIVNCHIKKINEHSLENPERKICSTCGKSFSLFSYIKHHKAIHLVKEGKELRIKKSRSKVPSSSSNLCSVCGKSFEKRATYLQHMRRSHGPPIPKKLKDEKTQKKQTETSRQIYQCWQCGKIKSTLCNLKVHMRIHTGEKPYECKFCFRKFSAWNSWHDHENIHLGLKPYQCEHCKKVFRQRSSLRKHLRSSVHGTQNKIDGEKTLL